MEIKSVVLWQPAVPMRAVVVWLDEDSKILSQDMPVLGMITELRKYSDHEDARHHVLAWNPLTARVSQSDSCEADYFRTIFAPASEPPEFWEKLIRSNGEGLREQAKHQLL